MSHVDQDIHGTGRADAAAIRRAIVERGHQLHLTPSRHKAMATVAPRTQAVSEMRDRRCAALYTGIMLSCPALYFAMCVASEVQADMSRLVHHLKILVTVIVANAISMVHDLIARQDVASRRFDNQAMLRDVPIDICVWMFRAQHVDIPLVYLMRLLSARLPTIHPHACSRAIFRGVGTLTRRAERYSADGASQLYAGSQSRPPACITTESCRLNIAWSYVVLIPAVLAHRVQDMLRCHGDSPSPCRAGSGHNATRLFHAYSLESPCTYFTRTVDIWAV